MRLRNVRTVLGAGLLAGLICVAHVAANAEDVAAQATSDSSTQAATRPWSLRVADAAMQRWPQGDLNPDGAPQRWQYEEGTFLQGMTAVWYGSADGKYYQYIKQAFDHVVDKDGNMAGYNMADYSLDQVLMGRQALLLYGVTGDAHYYKVARTLREQLAHQPRTNAGGFWHKQAYPSQMWLDGLYMAEPFYAQYARDFQEPKDFDDIAHQFIVLEKHVRDPKTGLLYHGWDESRQQRWADKESGLSSQFWARGMGWYAMALVDTLPYFPDNDPHRSEMIAILNRLATAIVKYQDARTGVWYQVMDKADEKGNFPEASASCMFVYALDKGVRLGYLPANFQQAGKKGWAGIQKQFVREGPGGIVQIVNIVKSAGLGGRPYRDGSYAYYVGEKIVTDDPKGVGAFLLAASEAEMTGTALKGRGKTALLDAWFNSQKRKNAAGQTEYFHYKWEDEQNSGYSFFAHAFRSYGVKTETLYTAPRLDTLKKAQIYVISSPDIPAKNPTPNYMAPADVAAVTQWVKQGGVLVLMENDGGSSEFEHFNSLSEKFGIHFNAVINNQVPGREFDKGKILVPEADGVFLEPHKFYMKEIASITPSGSAKTLLTWDGNVVMATVKYGKGTVYAVVDPWFYNEYTDGRKLPMDFTNYAGARELVRWLVEQVPTGR